MYYRARYYDQNIGRFVREDPIQFKGAINFYTYVKNRPTRKTDPSGKVAFSIPLTGAGIFGAYATPKGGPAGEGFCTGVTDTQGNLGFLCCSGFGGVVGAGGSLSIEAPMLVCPGCKTICDMETSLYVLGAAFGDAGAGMSATVGGGIDSEHITYVINPGVDLGEGTGGGVIAGSCKLIFGGKGCRGCKK
jgi:hypothetical protein